MRFLQSINSLSSLTSLFKNRNILKSFCANCSNDIIISLKLLHHYRRCSSRPLAVSGDLNAFDVLHKIRKTIESMVIRIMESRNDTYPTNSRKPSPPDSNSLSDSGTSHHAIFSNNTLTPDSILNAKKAINIHQDIVTKWEAIQEELRTKIITSDTEDWQRDPNFKELKFIAGLDISYPILPEPTQAKTENDGKVAKEPTQTQAHDSNNTAYAAIVVYSFPSLQLVYQDVQQITFNVPYVPGFLGFRETSPLVEAVQKLIKIHPEWTPGVLLVDGNGILHPQQAGLASHIGYETNLPCIGVSKNIYLFEGVDCTKKMVQDMKQVGDYVYIRDGSNKILGMALKTSKDAKNPVYVSIGHKISLETSRNIVLACSKYRIPEPIRMADFLSRELVRQQ